MAFERRRLRVYIAGPISKGDVFENVIAGVRAGRRMLQDGLAPYVPHLDAYMTLSAGGAPPEDNSGDFTLWNSLLEWDLEYVASSDAVYRLYGESKGADLECRVADELDIPVFYEDEYEVLLRYAEKRGLAGVRK